MEGFCKACLTKYNDPGDLLQYTEKNRRLFVYSTGLQVKPTDTIPFRICPPCFIHMKAACKFKKQCRTSDKKLNHFIFLKEGGEETDFCRYLQNIESSPFKFPGNPNNTPSLQKLKEDDNVSTSTSIRNFMTDMLRDEEIPDTEARIIREMIEQEADVLDDSLDSQWLQDDISIASDFRFNPYSTPLKFEEPVNNLPVKFEPQDLQEQPVDDRYQNIGRQNILAAKKLLYTSNSSPGVSESSQSEKLQMIKEKQNFLAAKKLLLNSKPTSSTCSNYIKNINRDSYIAAKRMLLNSKAEITECKNEMEIKIELDTDMKNSIFIPIVSHNTSSDIEPNYDVDESVTYDSIDENMDNKEIIKKELVGNSQVDEKEVGISILEDDKKDCIERNIEKALNNTNDEVISLSALLASPSTESLPQDKIGNNIEKSQTLINNEETPLNAWHNDPSEKPLNQYSGIIATPSVHQGLSGANTPTIANILFGENLNSTQEKPDSMVKERIDDGDVDMLEDFFNKETGDYIGDSKTQPEEIFDEFLNPVPNKLTPGGLKFDITDFSCKTCNLQYKTEKGLKLHYAKTHKMKICTERKREALVEISCDKCGKIFNYKSNLNRHIKVMHSSKTKQSKHTTCKHCTMEFSTEARLRLHMKTHYGVKHVPQKDSKPKSELVCYICGHVSTQPSNLKTHIARHNKTYKFYCDPCGRGCYTKFELQLHMRFHMNEKPFSCSHCDDSFRRKDQLRNHLKKHIGETPFTCPTCNKRFSNNDYLQKHMKYSAQCLKMKLDAAEKANEAIEESSEKCIVTEMEVTGGSAETLLKLIEESNSSLLKLIKESNSSQITRKQKLELKLLNPKIAENAKEQKLQSTHLQNKMLEEKSFNQILELDNAELSELKVSSEEKSDKTIESPESPKKSSATDDDAQHTQELHNTKTQKEKQNIVLEDLIGPAKEKQPTLHIIDDDRNSITDVFTIPFIIETDKNV